VFRIEPALPTGFYKIKTRRDSTDMANNNNNNGKGSTGKRAREGEGGGATKDEKGNNVYPLPVGHSTDRNSTDPKDIALRKKDRDSRKKRNKKEKQRAEAGKAIETEGGGLGRV